ncbi:hypothetical protein RMATCC62417_16570 [Rhizopus microsporus]|uniref:DUF1748-domain-containing protein n=2 Tax=Rhizopus microsporus TaxID=58291 RepID=A0A2G4SMP4_RHIZD|nr:DUF1748-domain-containing protein [Rhizopus microsporus ATCC 52813]ORE11125.1 DUF1748-domain-containing protein [Rhizopus microsporus var. microsporus]PHZ10039.1 DUF1748-domain-containing protein [Rhizopus microsporus ATCC 52813]CEG82507.1 hypothetical protein RMATCC62417_16570 [Rhizopus microsporus]
MLGRIFHFTADAVLVSTVLAGIKRNTGLEPATSQIEHEEIKKYVTKYLNIGEWVMDTSIGLMNSSPYFERKK